VRRRPHVFFFFWAGGGARASARARVFFFVNRGGACAARAVLQRSAGSYNQESEWIQAGLAAARARARASARAPARTVLPADLRGRADYHAPMLCLSVPRTGLPPQHAIANRAPLPAFTHTQHRAGTQHMRSTSPPPHLFFKFFFSLTRTRWNSPGTGRARRATGRRRPQHPPGQEAHPCPRPPPVPRTAGSRRRPGWARERSPARGGAASPCPRPTSRRPGSRTWWAGPRWRRCLGVAAGRRQPGRTGRRRQAGAGRAHRMRASEGREQRAFFGCEGAGGRACARAVCMWS